MKKVQFTVKDEHNTAQQSKQGNPNAIIEAVAILEVRVENLSRRAERLLELIASVR